MGELSRNSVVTERAVIATFNKTFKATAPHPLMAIARKYSSANLIERHVGLGEVAEMREFKDEKVETGIAERALTVENKRYEATVKLHKDAIRLDNSGTVDDKIASITRRGMLYPGKLLSDLLIAAEGTTISAGYDGVAFFSNSHPVTDSEGGVQDNLFSKTSATPSSANILTDLTTAISFFRGVKDSKGVPMNEGMDLDLVMVVPPGIEKAVREALGADMLSNTTNVDKNRARYIVNPRFTDSGDFYVFNVSDPLAMPLGLQENDPLKPSFLGEGSDTYFRTGYALASVEWMGRAFYSWWQNACKFT